MNSFIGNQPATSFESPKKQVSTSNSGTTITLDYPVTSVADIRLTINAVVQSYDNYSVSGSTLTVGGTLNNDRVEILFVGRTYGSIVPSDASIVTSSLQDGAVTNVKLGSDINATKLTAGLVPTARLGSGTASSSTVLYGDQTYKTAPSGAMTLITRASSSGAVGDIAVDNCFSDTYDYYKIYFWINAEDDEGELRFRWRKSGSDRTDSYYINTGYASQKSSSASSSYTGFQQWNADHFVFLNNLNENDNMGSTVELTIYDPRARDEGCLATVQYHGSHYRDDNLWVNINGGGMYGNQGSGDDFDGFKLYIDNSNIKYYDYAIYGFNKT